MNYEDAIRPERINFKVNARFKDRDALRFAISSYAVYHTFRLKNYYCSPIKIISQCIGRGNQLCSWRVYGRKIYEGLPVFSIISFCDIHTYCVAQTRSERQSRA